MYTFGSRVRYSEVDETGKLTTTSIMNYLQDCSTFQSEDLGMGIEYLKKNGRAWWLASWHIMIDRYPRLGETIEIGTRPYAFKGMYGYRNFVIKDQQGKYLVRADSVWFFYDILMGRPVKAEECDIRGYEAGREGPLTMDVAPRKIRLPETYLEKDSLTVCKRHIDTNHHVNNAQYVEIAKETLPEAFTIGEMKIEFKKAAVCGDTVRPRISQIDDGYIISLCDKNGEQYANLWMKEKR